MDGLRYKWMASFGEHFRYKFHPGMIAWALHRITGIGVAVFLTIHIWSISHLGGGKYEFDAAMSLYSTPLFKVGEFLLFATILIHAMNGLRIVCVDFFGGAKYQKKLFGAAMIVAAIIFVIGVFVRLGAGSGGLP